MKQIKSPFLNYQQVSLSLINGWYFFQPSTYIVVPMSVIIQKWNVHNQCSSIIYYYILSETLIFASIRISFHNYLCRHAKIASNLRFDSSRQIFHSTQSLWEWETEKFIYSLWLKFRHWFSPWLIISCVELCFVQHLNKQMNDDSKFYCQIMQRIWRLKFTENWAPSLVSLAHTYGSRSHEIDWLKIKYFAV